MKKAKIMLMAIAVIAMVGGALAFKAAKNVKSLYYCTTTSVGGSLYCVQGFYSTQPGVLTTLSTSAVFTTLTSHAGLTTVCPATTSPLSGCYTVDNPTTVFFNQ